MRHPPDRKYCCENFYSFYSFIKIIFTHRYNESFMLFQMDAQEWRWLQFCVVKLSSKISSPSSTLSSNVLESNGEANERWKMKVSHVRPSRCTLLLAGFHLKILITLAIKVLRIDSRSRLRRLLTASPPISITTCKASCFAVLSRENTSDWKHKLHRY